MARKPSKSDEVLAQQLGEVSGTPQKQHVTHAEALAEAQGITTPSDSTAATTTTAAKTPRTPKAAKLDADGNPIVTVARPKVAPGSPPSVVLASHITDPAQLHATCQLVKGDTADAKQCSTVGGIIDKLAKKVGEKAVNLLRHRNNPATVQVYTRIGLDLLMKSGTMTSKALTDEYLKTYKQGTARAQANQIMQLLPALQVADRTDRGTLALNDDSLIAADYRKARG